MKCVQRFESLIHFPLPGRGSNVSSGETSRFVIYEVKSKIKLIQLLIKHDTTNRKNI